MDRWEDDASPICGKRGAYLNWQLRIVSTAADSYQRRLPVLWDVAKSFASVLADLKTLFGIKLGLAGLLSVYLSQLIRLGHANWALFTVLVLAPANMSGQSLSGRLLELSAPLSEDLSGYGWSGTMNKIGCSFYCSRSGIFGSACTCMGARFSPIRFFCARTPW